MASTSISTNDLVFNLHETHQNPQLESLMVRLRSHTTTNKDFREALERIAESVGYEIAKDLPTRENAILTSLGGIAYHSTLKYQPVIIGILRAGIPMVNGLLKAYPEAEAGFIGAMRDEGTAKSKTSYVAIPDIRDRHVILADTMIATGGSIAEVLKIIEPMKPKDIVVAGIIASQPGIERLLEYGKNIYVAAIDPELNDKSYIVPGLGDAGDRCYGKKI